MNLTTYYPMLRKLTEQFQTSNLQLTRPQAFLISITRVLIERYTY